MIRSHGPVCQKFAPDERLALSAFIPVLLFSIDTLLSAFYRWCDAEKKSKCPAMLLGSSRAGTHISAEHLAAFLLQETAACSYESSPDGKELRHFLQPWGTMGQNTQPFCPYHSIVWPCAHHATRPWSLFTISGDKAERGEENASIRGPRALSSRARCYKFLQMHGPSPHMHIWNAA